MGLIFKGVRMLKLVLLVSCLSFSTVWAAKDCSKAASDEACCKGLGKSACAASNCTWLEPSGDREGMCARSSAANADTNSSVAPSAGSGTGNDSKSSKKRLNKTRHD